MTINTGRRLANCPFCGGRARRKSGLYCFVECVGCGARTYAACEMYEAVRLWNNRVEAPTSHPYKPRRWGHLCETCGKGAVSHIETVKVKDALEGLGIGRRKKP